MKCDICVIRSVLLCLVHLKYLIPVDIGYSYCGTIFYKVINMYIININSFLNNELDYNTNKVVLSDIIYLVHILFLSMTSGTSMYI